MGPKAWIQRLQSLGQALVELLEAELEALNADLKGSAQELGKGVGLLLFAAFLAFWVLAGLAWGTVEVVALWLPRWGAVFAVTGFWALVALIVGLWGRSRLRRLETPARTVKRHFASHQAFVRQELLGDREAAAGASPPESREAVVSPRPGSDGGD